MYPVNNAGNAAALKPDKAHGTWKSVEPEPVNAPPNNGKLYGWAPASLIKFQAAV